MSDSTRAFNIDISSLERIAQAEKITQYFKLKVITFGYRTHNAAVVSSPEVAIEFSASLAWINPR